MAKMSFYLGERFNPQLKKSYYRRYGQLTKKEARARENTPYGSMTLKPFATEAEYQAEIDRLQKEGYSVY